MKLTLSRSIACSQSLLKHSLQSPRLAFLDHESLHPILQLPNLRHQITALIRSDAGCDHGSGNTTCSAQSSLTGDVDVWNVLIFGEKGKVEENSEW